MEPMHKCGEEEEVSEEEVTESESGSTKDMVLEELNKEKGNYSDPEASRGDDLAERLHDSGPHQSNSCGSRETAKNEYRFKMQMKIHEFRNI